MSEHQKINDVADGLLRIERELRRLGAWSEDPPGKEALGSTQPFAVDALTFTEWLQFIFLTRMKELIEHGQPLPAVSGMAPMAEEYFRGRPESGAELVHELELMDQLLSS